MLAFGPVGDEVSGVVGGDFLPAADKAFLLNGDDAIKLVGLPGEGFFEIVFHGAPGGKDGLLAPPCKLCRAEFADVDALAIITLSGRLAGIGDACRILIKLSADLVTADCGARVERLACHANQLSISPDEGWDFEPPSMRELDLKSA